MFAFELWREYKLSIAEIFSFFPESEIIFFSEKILILDWINEDYLVDIMKNLWWTIKITMIDWGVRKHWNNTEIYDLLKPSFTEWIKNNYAINFYWKTRVNQKDFILKFKKELQKDWFSSRFVNQDFANLNSYKVIKEKLVEKKTDFNLYFNAANYYLWITIFIQDIDNYSKRDYWKERDMEIWMLPPKLAQMMLNLATNSHPEFLSGSIKHNQSIKDSGSSPEWKVIYDPFCWLGTVLLESIIAWNSEIYGSDINSNMVKITLKNIDFIKWEFENKLKKYEVIEMDASDIKNSSILKNNKIDAIVSEWYLWQIFWKNSINLWKIENERKKLLQIWEWFFSWLKSINFSWNIVICFPFWEVSWLYYYFEEIYIILEKYCEIQKLLSNKLKDFNVSETKSWSLLYKRDNQTVWREIFKLKIKK